MPKVEMTRADIAMSPDVRPEHAISERSHPFIAGTGPLRVVIWREWWWTPVAFAVTASLACFLYYSFEVSEFFWAQNVVVFFVMLLSFFALPFIAFGIFFAFRRRNEPRRPSHVVLGTVTKQGYPGNATRSTTINFQSPHGPRVTTKIVTNTGDVAKGQRVAMLYYGDNRVGLL